MKKLVKHTFWVFTNLYGRVFGRAWLAGFHQVILNTVLHGLGYDNGYRPSYTGESWFIHNVLKKSEIKTAFDIGANVGAYATELADELSCEIYAFEPAQETFSVLESATAGFPNIHPFRCALSDFDGTAEFFSDPMHSHGASLARDLVQNMTNHEQTPVQTLDSFVRQHGITRLDFIKIDTEGFEREVVRGMQGTLSSLKPRYIQFEFNILQLYRGYTLREVTQMLSGYEFYRLLPRGWLKINPDRFSSNIFMFCNIVAVRKTQ